MALGAIGKSDPFFESATESLRLIGAMLSGYDCDFMDQGEIETLHSKLTPVLQLEKKVQELGT